MIPSTLFAIIAAFSTLAAVNGAVIQRDGTSTPEPTAPAKTAPTTTTTSAPTSTSMTSSSLSSTSSTQSTTPTIASTTATTTGPATTTTTTSAPTSASTTSSLSSSTHPIQSTTPTTASTTATTKKPETTTTASSPTAASTTSSRSSSTHPIQSTTPTTPCPTTTTPSASPSVTAHGTANCNGVQQWQASFAYNAGDRVIFNDQLFTAKQWTYNNSPPAHLDQWNAGGTCAQPINNQANCDGVAAWESTVPYTSGSKVTFNSHLWVTVQWSQSNFPGDTSGSWQDLGACA